MSLLQHQRSAMNKCVSGQSQIQFSCGLWDILIAPKATLRQRQQRIRAKDHRMIHGFCGEGAGQTGSKAQVHRQWLEHIPSDRDNAVGYLLLLAVLRRSAVSTFCSHLTGRRHSAMVKQRSISYGRYRPSMETESGHLTAACRGSTSGIL